MAKGKKEGTVLKGGDFKPPRFQLLAAPLAVTLDSGPQVRTPFIKDDFWGPATSSGMFKPCRTAAPKKGSSKKKPLRECHVELDFLGPEKSDKKLFFMREGSRSSTGKLAPGAYVRVCWRAREPGRLIPVANAAEAKAVERQFCSLRSKAAQNAAKSAADAMPGDKVVLGGLARRRRR